MPYINFYFQVHQPFRLKKISFFEIGKGADYFDSQLQEQNNQVILNKVANKCYFPTNQLMLELLNKYPDFKISYSLSGVFIEQAKKYLPELIDSFKALVDTGRCEILSETYYHSLAFLYSKLEFREQVAKHKELIKKTFSVNPKIFRNTELIYSNDLAWELQLMGYKAVLTEGVDRVLGWQNPNFVYEPNINLEHLPTNESNKKIDIFGVKKNKSTKIKLLLKNYKLSDDIAFRFSNKGWSEFPLSADKFSHWINQINGNGEIVNLFMDYETFGEHQWEDTGIFEFLRHLPEQIFRLPDSGFITPSEAVNRFESKGIINIPNYISWADQERDLSAWKSNHLQEDALNKIYSLEEKIKKTKDEELIHTWRKLQTSDHFYYMCTKYWSDGDVHKYFSPYESPYEAFIYFANALQDLELEIELAKKI